MSPESDNLSHYIIGRKSEGFLTHKKADGEQSSSKGKRMEEKVVSLLEGEVAIVFTSGRLAVHVEMKDGKLVVLVLREDEDGNWTKLTQLTAEEND